MSAVFDYIIELEYGVAFEITISVRDEVHIVPLIDYLRELCGDLVYGIEQSRFGAKIIIRPSGFLAQRAVLLSEIKRACEHIIGTNGDTHPKVDDWANAEWWESVYDEANAV